MKRYFVLFFLPCSLGSICSQSTLPGYYISLNGDTIITQIKIRKGVFGHLNNDFTNEITIIENNSNSKKFSVNDIKGYGFTHAGDQYKFVSKPVKNGSHKFLVPVITGPKTSLYQYGINTAGNGTSLGSNQVFYTFEREDNTFLFLNNILNKKFRTQLKDFYKDNTEALILIDTKLKYWDELQQDLSEILDIVNKS